MAFPGMGLAEYVTDSGFPIAQRDKQVLDDEPVSRQFVNDFNVR